MQICRRCNEVMKHGTHYEKDKHNQYNECPKCHTRIDSRNEQDFSQVLDEEMRKYRSNKIESCTSRN